MIISTPRISLIAACSKNRVIGFKGNIPWHIAEDFQFFKSKTEGKPIIMGRITFETLPFPLPRRKHIILSHKAYTPTTAMTPNDGFIVCHDIKDALMHAQKYINPTDPEIMIIGGDAIYNMTLPLAHRIYLTEINIEVEGDAFFPAIPENDWKEISRISKTDHELSYDFVTYERITS